MTYTVNLKKCRGSNLGCPGLYDAPALTNYQLIWRKISRYELIEYVLGMIMPWFFGEKVDLVNQFW